MTPPFEKTLKDMLNARVPLVYLVTWEEERATQAIAKVAASLKTPRKVYVWTAASGLICEGQTMAGTAANGLEDDESRAKLLELTGNVSAVAALRKIDAMDEPGVFVLKDLHRSFEPGCSQDRLAIRLLRDMAGRLKNGRRAVVITAPALVLPLELQKDVAVVDFAMPDFAYIRDEILTPMIEANRQTGRIKIDLNPEETERLARAAVGLTVQEAETAFARAMVDDGRLDIDDVEMVLEEKRQIIKKSGVLEFVRSESGLNDVGGLNNLKRWLGKRNRSWGEAARRYGLPNPKGMLLAGVPGCGKSLVAKAVSAAWGVPLLRLDVGRIFNKYTGESENNVRAAIQTAEAIAPCVLWVDEIEKGMSYGESDNGTSARIFATFLTWMQEKDAPVFVMATANDISRLPPEMLRKGRFDEVFFVDLPTSREREAILRLHLEKRLRDPGVRGDFSIDGSLPALVEMTEGYSGAELENVVISGLFEAFSESRALRMADLERAARNTVPLSVTQAEKVMELRVWAASRAVSASARDDRDGYGETPAAASAEKPTPETMNETRGGRTVDF